MYVRRIFIQLACLAFLFATLAGAHTHRVAAHAENEAAHIAGLVTAIDPAHFDEHRLHGDVDSDSVLAVPGKTPWLLILLGAGCVLALIARLPFQRASLSSAPERPPRSLSREHRLPPSQAPPFAA